MSDLSHNEVTGLEGVGLWERARNRFADWRNSLVTDKSFQEWAKSFWPTRPMVRSRQKALFDLTAGFVYSQILYSCVSLGLFDILKAGPCKKAELSSKIGLDLEATSLLLEAACALKLVSLRADVVRLADLGAAVVANPGIAAMVKHHEILYRDLADPIALLKGEIESTELSKYWSYATSNSPDRLGRDTTDDYSHLMAVSQEMVSAEVIAAYPFHRHKKILDVGGGEGAFLKAVAASVPSIDLTLFDLPSVAERANERMSELGYGHRFNAYGGSFFADDLPKGADIISLVRVCYDHSDEKVAKILDRAWNALPKGGVLLIAEPMAGISGAEAMGAAYFGFYLKAMQSGKARTYSQLSQLVLSAGFSQVKRCSTRSPVLTSVLITHK